MRDRDDHVLARDQGFVVDTATSQAEAIERFTAKGYDLLLCDIRLQDGDGFDVLARMRKHQSLGNLPIVLLTAKNEPGDIGRGLVLGADGYVTKPYTKNILADVIRRVLKQDL